MSRKAEARVGGVSVPYLGGDLVNQRIQRTLEVMAARLGLLGVLADPRMSIPELVSLQGVGGSDYKPLRILLPEGTWSFDAAGVTVARDKIQFEAVGGGYTVFQRTAVTTTGPLLTLAGEDCRIVGVRFEDASTTDYALSFADFGTSRTKQCKVVGCWFQDCWRAIHSASAAARIVDNVIFAQRDTTYQIRLTAGLLSVVQGTVSLSSTGLTVIYADDAVTKSTFLGNTCHGNLVTFVLDYKTTGATLNVQAANVGTVNAR
ncbi:MAG: hypothetical protein A3E78_08770 [Alphaproteobacteria bacterium RIFCSPHIGHO2_12_FULL_63_12]|nr:MAG: hypothetical protein A3E78_08770 [Alphaproteobacteria bacterium RIFCSPHIGHO2_12_FULL_63_12]